LFYIIEVAALNAYVLDKQAHTGRDSRDYLAFRIALAKELVGSFKGGKHIGRSRSRCVGEAGLCGGFKGTAEVGIDQESVQARISNM